MCALVALVLLFNPDLAFGGLIPAGYDTFVYFYPLREYFAQSVREGRVPLWNPHLFLGTPFLANPQAAVLYPGTWLFALLPVPRAYVVNLLGHYALAAVGVYALARCSLGLRRPAALLGGASFAFSGFMVGQAGHINQLSVAAWLPMAVVTLDLALRTRSPAWLAGLVGVLVVQLLAGHPQEVYMTLAVLAVFTAWRRLPSGPLAMLRSWGLLAVATAFAAGIAAVQLLPSAELAAHSIRGGGLSFTQATVDSLRWQLLLPALFPGFWTHLHTTELFGHLGVVVLVIACMGVTFGAPGPAALGGVLVLIGLGLALGHANPLYRVLFDWAPGFGSFRVPARWLMVYTFGASLLVAVGVDWLASRRPLAFGWRSGLPSLPASSALRSAVFGLGIPVALVALALMGERQSGWLMLTWAALASVALALALLAMIWHRGRTVAVVALVLVGLGELWVASADLELRHPMPAFPYAQLRPSTELLLSSDGLDGRYRTLSIATPEYEVKETPEYRERYVGLHPEAVKNLLVAVKLNETLWPNVPLQYRLDSADGYDGGVLPLAGFYQLASAMLGPDRARPDGVLAGRLDSFPEPRWLDLLGVRYVLAGRVKDLTRDALYYDRAISVRLQPGERLELAALPLGEFNRLGMISSYRGAPVDSRTVGRLELWRSDGSVHVEPLRDGEHTASADVPPAAFPHLERVQAWGAGGQSDPGDRVAQVSFPRRPIARLAIVNDGERILDVRALNLVDDVRQASFSLVLDDQVHRTEFFDMKVYERRDALSRAYLVSHAEVLSDQDVARRLGEPTFDPARLVLLAPGPGAEPLAADSPNDGVATLEISAPEQLRIRTRAASPAYLVVSDSWFPGWGAAVDGTDVPIVRANLLFRAVRLAPGEHVVELRYEPTSVRVGAAISLGSLLVGVLLMVAARRRHRRSLPAATPS